MLTVLFALAAILLHPALGATVSVTVNQDTIYDIEKVGIAALCVVVIILLLNLFTAACMCMNWMCPRQGDGRGTTVVLQRAGQDF
jgi:hypothetical protein